VNLEPLHPVQLARFREMTRQEKWDLARNLLRMARVVRRAGIRRRHPEWSREEVERALAEEFTHGRT